MSWNIYKYERSVRVWSDVILKGCPIAAGRGRLPTARVSAGIPGWFYPCYSLSSDDRLTRCWRSSEQYFLFPWSPGDGQATSPSALAALGPKRRQAHWGAASSFPWRWGERPATTQARTFLVSDSASLRSPPCLTAILCKLWSPPTPAPTHSLPLSLLSSLKPEREQRQTTVHLSLSWQCYCSEACWEQWWDVRLDPQVRAGPVRGCTAEGLPTPLRLCCVFFLSEGVKAPFPKALSFQILTLSAAGKIKKITALPLEAPIIYVIIPLMSDDSWQTDTHTFKCKYNLILVIISIFKPSQFLIV